MYNLCLKNDSLKHTYNDNSDTENSKNSRMIYR